MTTFDDNLREVRASAIEAGLSINPPDQGRNADIQDKEKREFMEFKETVRQTTEPPVFGGQTSLKIEEFARIFNARHAPPPLPEEARKKLEFSFDQALYYVNEMFRVTNELQDSDGSSIIWQDMYKGLFDGMRRLRARYSIPQWGTRLPNEDSANSSVGETGD